MVAPVALDLDDHADAVASHHRFPQISFRNTAWDLTHLDPYAFRADVGNEGVAFFVDVVVLFSCHCFTKGDSDGKAPPSELFRDGREVRVLCEERYTLSRRFLPALVQTLFGRHVRVASSRPNYVTIEMLGSDGLPGYYAVFFEVQKDIRRKKRLLLRVQSAYRIETLSKSLQKGSKVNFGTLLRATYEGRRIKG